MKSFIGSFTSFLGSPGGAIRKISCPPDSGYVTVVAKKFPVVMYRGHLKVALTWEKLGGGSVEVFDWESLEAEEPMTHARVRELKGEV